MTSGEKLIGKVLSETPASIEFESAGLGKIQVPRDRVQRLETDDTESKAAAPVPGAQEPAAPQPAPGEVVAQTPTPKEAADKKREDLLRMYWEEGLRYQISQPITVAVPFSGGERTVGEEVKVTGKLGLKLSLDAATFSSTGGQQPLDPDLDVRTFRLYSNGELDLFGRTLYAVQFGSVSGNFYLHEAYLRRPGVEHVGNVTFGYLTVAQTLENIYPFGSLVFMEAASPSLAFAPGNRMGVQLDRTYQNDRVSATFGIYSVGADPGLNFGDTSQSLVRPTLRLTGLPILSPRRSRV